MSLLDSQFTPAWTTVLIDDGPAFGAQRYRRGFTPLKYLDNFAALSLLSQFPLTSSLFQWNGQQWQPLIRQ